MESAAAVIGITEATIRTASKLWKLTNAWRDAPEDVHRLRDDLSRTQQFFDEVRHSASLAKLSESWDQSSPFETELKLLLEGGIAILKRIETFVDGLLGDSPGLRQDTLLGIGKRRRLAWITNSRKIAQLRRELRLNVSSICRILITQNVSISTEIYATLKRSQTEIESNVRSYLQDTSERIAFVTTKTTQASQSAILGHVDDRLTSIEAKLVAVVEHSIRQSLSIQGNQQQVSYEQRPLPAKEAPCRCRSTSRYHWETASFRPSLGLVSLTYHSGKLPREQCSNPSCKSRQYKRWQSVQFAYHFPDWLVRAALSVSLHSNLNGNPQANLRIFTHIPNTRDVGLPAAIRRGEVETVKALLSDGAASVHDVIGEQLCSPLWVATVLRRVDCVGLLLQAGADPYHETESYHGSSPIRVAFERSLSGNPIDVQLANLFPLNQYYEDEDYSPLHLAVLGILRLDLPSALRQPHYLVDLNRHSRDGLNPLLTASILGNVPAVKLLLRAGADVEIESIEGIRPLHFACRNGHYEVVRLLLAAGARIDVKDSYGRTPFSSAAACHHIEAVNILSMLVEHGGKEITRPYPGEVSALHYAISVGMLEAARFLVEQAQVDIDYPSTAAGGRTPLLTALVVKRHDCVRFLVESGADLRAVTDYGWGVLHFLANDGDAEMMEIFAEGEGRARLRALGLRGCIRAKDQDGMTPWELLSKRCVAGELWKAFERVLEGLEEEGSGVYVEEPGEINEIEDENGEGKGEGDEEYFDAVEDLNELETVVDELPTLVGNLALKNEAVMGMT
ncbi:ankyrin repeat-containing domain protein [Podospora aff. communis PSN243]|uniref:Ankyrin repeat-containing domain protein n=1 Tax=Podospora aff. communis PSN243 TaxID=3040156 RepID=A0AAV9GPJ6_9PEZI|nr:ankyrin repeat-containing domain protein [Podospora aff. communis PSN243]